MDDFLTPAERDLRRSARERFRPRRDRDADNAGQGFAPARIEGLSKELDFPGRSVFERALIVEEAAAASPAAARVLLGSAPAGAGAAALEAAWNVGTASAAVEAGLAAARDQGLFQSTLMGHQRVQGELAEALSAILALRLRTYRALRLIEAGRADLGGLELARAAAEAAEVRGRATALAGALAGAREPAGKPSSKERSGP